MYTVYIYIYTVYTGNVMIGYGVGNELIAEGASHCGIIKIWWTYHGDVYIYKIWYKNQIF